MRVFPESWRLSTKHGEKERQGTQIDLLFDRSDDTITLCEIKYSHQPFVIDKDYAKVLANKLQTFERHFGSKKQINFAFITAVGLRPNIWSEDLIQYVITLEDFFS